MLFFLFFQFFFSSFSFNYLIYWKFFCLSSSVFWFCTYFINIIFLFSFLVWCFNFFFFRWFWWFYFCFNLYLCFCFSFFFGSVSGRAICDYVCCNFFRFFFYLISSPWLISSMLFLFFLNIICIRISVVFNIPFIIVWWYLFNNFIYNWLSFYDFICFIYFYFSIKAWKLFQKFFITYYICRFIF